MAKRKARVIKRRTKRKSSFAGTKDEHAVALERRIDWLNANVVAARKAIEAEDCAEAFHKLLNGYASAEVANSERIYSGSKKWIARAALENELKYFHQSCLRKRGK